MEGAAFWRNFKYKDDDVGGITAHMLRLVDENGKLLTTTNADIDRARSEANNRYWLDGCDSWLTQREIDGIMAKNRHAVTDRINAVIKRADEELATAGCEPVYRRKNSVVLIETMVDIPQAGGTRTLTLNAGSILRTRCGSSTTNSAKRTECSFVNTLMNADNACKRGFFTCR